MKTIMLFSALALGTTLQAQNNFTFIVQYQLGGKNQQKAALVSLLVNGSKVNTNNDGSFVLTLPPNARQVIVKSPDDLQFIVLNEEVNLPRDAADPTYILLHKPSSTERANREIDRVLKLQGYSAKSLDSLHAVNREQYQVLRNQLDSLLLLMSKKYEVDLVKLRSARELLTGRDLHYPLISHTLQFYLNEVLDVRDALINIPTTSIRSRRGMELLDSTMRVYNSAYMQLNNQYNAQEKAVMDFWQNPELAYHYANVVDYALNNIHRGHVLDFNLTLTPKINAYWATSHKRTKSDLIIEIDRELDKKMPILSNHLVVLNDKIRDFLMRLSAEKNIINH